MFNRVILAAVAFGLGMLFAPKSGKETRQDIRDGVNRKAKELRDKVKK